MKIQYSEATTFILTVAKYESKITFEEIRKWFNSKSEIIEDEDVENYLNKTALGLMLGDE